MTRARLFGGIGALIALVACGGSDDVTGSSGVPKVSGNYSGTVQYVFPELSASLSCPASTVVTQSGSNVNIAPIVATGECGGMSIPLGAVTIDSTGALMGSGASGSYTEPSCGTYSYTISGGFYGKEFRLTMNATSATCYNFNFTSILSR